MSIGTGIWGREGPSTSPCAVQCSELQYSTVQCSKVQCSTLQFREMACNAMQWNTMKCSEVHQNVLMGLISVPRCLTFCHSNLEGMEYCPSSLFTKTEGHVLTIQDFFCFNRIGWFLHHISENHIKNG